MISFNTIYNEDCLETLDRIDNDFIDLTITSPPYNVDLNYDQYKDSMPYPKYLEWLEVIFRSIYQKTKIGGRCVINIGDLQNGKCSLHSDIIHLMNNIGWLNFTIIIWNKGHTSARTAWGSWMSPINPSFPRPFEYIIVFSKKQLNLSYKGEPDLTRQEFIDWSYGMWSFKPETKKLNHPAPFPIELPKRCMKMLSWKDCVVFDPFMGSGTTAVACKMHGRKFIGSEISVEYCNISQKRIFETIIYDNEQKFF